MELTSITFLIFAISVIVLSNCFPSMTGRRCVIAIASVAFIGSHASSVLHLVPLLFFLLLSYGVVRSLQWRSSGPMLYAGLAMILTSFIYLKQFSVIDSLPTLPFLYLMLGLSYILFRVIHLAVDIRQGALRDKIGPLEFFSYTCNFLTLVSGPIQRYQDFMRASKARLLLDNEIVSSAFSRLVKGFVKVAVISAIANYAFESLSKYLMEQGNGLSLPSMATLYAMTAMVYTIYLYYNFSGYMDIVIGIGWLVGFDLPENFNKPFLSRNFLEFWSRWHMTLSDWFKTYVFNPLMKTLVTRIQVVAWQPALGVVAFFVTFLLMGMWHGTSSMFLIYGLMMGAGASLNKIWQMTMSRFLGKKRYKALADQTFYKYLCTGMTCSWFALALSCFWTDMSQLSALARSLGTLGLFMAFCALAIASGVVLGVTGSVASRLAPLAYRIPVLARGTIARNLVLATHVMVIVTVTSFFHKAPEFVYRAF
jgi:alginate O-acetyltransferase complex protein AlgI